jgi:predicted GIY-YIG superfamily endonuclease
VARYTAERQPVALVYSEEHISTEAAIWRERQLKRWTSAKEALITGDVATLKRLTRSHQRRRVKRK